MVTVGVKDLKNRLSHYLRLVRSGELVVVTDRGRPIAELGGPGRVASPGDTDSRLLLLASRGIVTLPDRRGPRRFRPIRYSGPPMADALAEDREDRF